MTSRDYSSESAALSCGGTLDGICLLCLLLQFWPVNIAVILLVLICKADREIKRHISSPETGILELTDT